MKRQLGDAVCDGLREEVRQFLKSRPDLSPIDIAQHTRLADCTVRSFVRGGIPGGRQVVGEIRRVLDLAQAGEILQPGSGEGIVLPTERSQRVVRLPKRQHSYETQTLRRVGDVLDWCAERAAIGVITADFGTGKTWAVDAWRRGKGKNTATLVYEFTEYSSTNKVEFIREVATSLGLDTPPGSQTGGRIFHAVCEKLWKSPHLLVFDQAETCRARIFQVIRQVHDRTREAGVGVVLLAAPILLARLQGMADLGALSSRVGVWAPLTGVTKEEMVAIVKREGITDVHEDAFDAWWKATGGSMRRLMAGIELLRAKHGARRVTEKTIAGLAGHLWGMNVAAEAA